MADVTLADHHYNEDQLREFIATFASRHQNTFSVTLVKENGQGYNAVFHGGGADPKIRIALVGRAYPTIVSSTFNVSDIVKEQLSVGGMYKPEVENVVNSTIMGLLGSVRLTVREVEPGKPDIVSAHFHEGEIWP